ncbi:thioredoxin family protein [Rhodoflexus sp.]
MNYRHYFEIGVSYAEYLQQAEKEAQIEPKTGYLPYVPLNLQRMKRIGKQLKISEALQNTIANLSKKIYWLIISENWCGDAAQSLPVFHAIAALSGGKINLRIVYRDQHPELMDAHLTNGSRSIPVLIQLDEDFRVTGTWGPRPAEAQQKVMAWRKANIPFQEYAENLHKWYTDDKQQAIQTEIAALINHLPIS